MMKYELFKNIVPSRIKEFLPEPYREYSVRLSTMKKVNQTMDCMNLMPPDDESQATPNVYLNELYKEFQECEDLNYVLKKAAAMIVYAFEKLRPPVEDINFADWTDQIVINIINTEDNWELLQELPHREILDLSVIYRFIMGRSGDNLATVRVDYQLMEEIGLDEEELFQLALNNTRRMYPVVIESLDEMRLVETKEAKAVGGERKKGGGKKTPAVTRDEVVNSIQFITNSIRLHGAACMVFDEELFAVAQKMKSSFYLIPSSVHEVIAISEKFADPRVLESTLREANKQDFVGVEKLSDRLYFYDRKERTLSFAC